MSMQVLKVSVILAHIAHCFVPSTALTNHSLLELISCCFHQYQPVKFQWLKVVYMS